MLPHRHGGGDHPGRQVRRPRHRHGQAGADDQAPARGVPAPDARMRRRLRLSKPGRLQASRSAKPQAARTPMIDLKRILVPTDFSAHSQQALTYGVAFAEKFDAELYLLHVFQDLTVYQPDAVTI